jgi:hypothetical protein
MALNLNVGQHDQITITPSGTYTYTSSDTSRGTVSSTGRVTAVSVGLFTVTVKNASNAIVGNVLFNVTTSGGAAAVITIDALNPNLILSTDSVTGGITATWSNLNGTTLVGGFTPNFISISAAGRQVNYPSPLDVNFTKLSGTCQFSSSVAFDLAAYGSASWGVSTSYNSSQTSNTLSVSNHPLGAGGGGLPTVVYGPSQYTTTFNIPTPIATAVDNHNGTVTVAYSNVYDSLGVFTLTTSGVQVDANMFVIYANDITAGTGDPIYQSATKSINGSVTFNVSALTTGHTYSFIVANSKYDGVGAPTNNIGDTQPFTNQITL